MQCPFSECKVDTVLPSESLVHLVVAVDKDNQTYIHGPYDTEDGKAWVGRMLVEVARLAGIDLEELGRKEREYQNTLKKVMVQ